MNETVSTILSGLAVGASMTVPGLSGGSAAMVIGIYDRLISAVSRIFSEPAKQLPFLLKFCAGAAAGVFGVSWAVSLALDSPAGIPMRFFFLGAVAGGIPFIFRKAGLKKLTGGSALLILAGAAAVVLLAMLPEGMFSPGQGGLTAVLTQLLGGLITAAALVLPGISASHVMLMLGIYEPAAECLSRLDILPLVPLGAGLAAGTFLTARALEKLIERHSKGCFLVILGFMAGSLRELVPKDADGVQLAIGAACAVMGFAAARLLCDNRKAPEKGVSNAQ